MNGGALVGGTTGATPSITLNDTGDVVAFYQGAFGLLDLNYSIGKFNNGFVDWGEWQNSGTRGGGANPATAIQKNGNKVIMVYNDASKVYSRLGGVDTKSKKIIWDSPESTEWGVYTSKPSISVNGNNKIVGVFIYGENKIAYRLGTLNSPNINWDPYFYDIPNLEDKTLTSPSVAITDDNFVVIAFIKQGKACYKVGKISGNQIAFDSEIVELYPTSNKISLAGNNNRFMLLSTSTLLPPAGMFYDTAYAFMYYSDWIGDNLSTFGSKSLKKFILPGSHDAGMSLVQKCNIAVACNTQTQSLSILEQLKAGIRYFDIRPMLDIEDNLFYTGHFSDPIPVAGRLGCYGEKLEDILSSIVNFLEPSNRREIIILSFSHYLARDKYNGTFPLTLAQQNRLLDEVQNKLDPYLYKTAFSGRLANLPLATLLSSNSIVLPLVGILNVPMRPGFYTSGSFGNGGTPNTNRDFAIFSDYANKNKLDEMISDQFLKLGVGTNHSGDMFELQWILTPSEDDVKKCYIDPTKSIQSLASAANSVLYDKMVDAVKTKKITLNTIPNIISTDYCQREMTSTCLWLNKQL